jgi:tetratricopeptide (TPR) repeat protein
LNGLGNISLFALEDYETALEYYQLSLKWNPASAAALFGTGMIFHHLGKYAESNLYLDRMLESDLSRDGHTSEEAVRYYQGEANYSATKPILSACCRARI